MGCISINEEHTIWISLIGSLLIHGLLFVFSGTTFIKHAQYSVQLSAQMVEVSITSFRGVSEMSDEAVAKTETKSVKIAKRPAVAHNEDHSKSGVKVKANPDYFQNPAPEYPELAKQMGQEGLVRLSVDVNRQGDPVYVAIIQSSGYSLLDQAALKAVRHWKFRPGSIGGTRVESTVTIPIRFRLEK